MAGEGYGGDSTPLQRLLFEQCTLGLALCRVDGSLVDINPAYAAMLGRTVAETLGLTYWDITPREYGDQEEAQLQSLLRTGKYGPYEKEYLRKNGTRVPVRLSGCLLQHGGETLIWSSAEDLSEIRRSETALRHSEQASSDLLSRISDGFVALDKDWNFTYLNEQAAALFGRKPSELIGRHLWTEFPEGVGQPCQQQYERALRDQVFIAFEDHHTLRDRWFENRVFPSPEGLAIFFHEITDRRLAETLIHGQNQVLEMTAAGAPLAETLAALIRLIESQSPGMLGSILLLDEDGIHVRHGAAPTLPAAFIAAVDGQPIGPCAGSCGTAAYRKAAVYVEDIATDPLWAAYRAVALPHGLRACWSTPIFDAQRQVLGLFAMYYREPGLPRPQHRQLIDIATHTAAITIQSYRTAKAVRESEARIRSVFEQANDGIYILSAENRYLDANPRGLALLGYTRDELLRMGVAEVLAPHEVARLAVEPPRMMSGVPHFAEWEHVHKDGSTFQGEVSAQRLDDASYMAIVRDLTERRRIEASLRDREEQLRFVSDHAPVFLAQCDREKRYTFVNQSYADFFGLEPSALIGRPTREILGEAGFAMAEPHMDLALSGHPTTYDFVLPAIPHAPRALSVTYAPELDASGRVVGFIAAVSDITRRKEAEDTLAQRVSQLAVLNALGTRLSSTLDFQARVQAALEGSLEATAADLALLFLREGGTLRLVGSSSGGADLRHGETPVHQVGHCLCGLGAQGGRPLYAKDIHADLRCTWEECKQAGVQSFAVLPLKNGEEVIGVLGLASQAERDFEQQAAFLETLAAQVGVGLQNALLHQRLRDHAALLEQRVEERTALLRDANEDLATAVQRAQAADHAKSAFLAAMSHELRTPLNSVIGFTGVLLGGLAGALRPEQREPLEIVQRNGRHLLDLINDVLDLSKIEAKEMRLSPGPFDLAQVAREALDAVSPAAQAKGLSLLLDAPPGALTLPGDRRRTAQILLNLLSNAVKFTEAGAIALRLSIGDGQALAAIQDTGPGIAEDDLPRLFREFEQLDVGLGRRNEGTGLGLALSQRLARLMGGDISVASTLGQGTTFTLALPLAQPTPLEAP